MSLRGLSLDSLMSSFGLNPPGGAKKHPNNCGPNCGCNPGMPSLFEAASMRAAKKAADAERSHREESQRVLSASLAASSLAGAPPAPAAAPTPAAQAAATGAVWSGLLLCGDVDPAPGRSAAVGGGAPGPPGPPAGK
jgi:hypothetical protein